MTQVSEHNALFPQESILEYKLNILVGPSYYKKDSKKKGKKGSQNKIIPVLPLCSAGAASLNHPTLMHAASVHTSFQGTHA